MVMGAMRQQYPNLLTQGVSPDGAAPPNVGGQVTTRSILNGPAGTNADPLTGFVRNQDYSGAGIYDVVRNTPTALINDVTSAAGMDPNAGIGDILSSIASPDQLDALYALLSASQGAITPGPNAQGNFISNFYQGLLGQQGVPSMAQMFGGAFGHGATQPTSPLYGLLTGGSPSQQLGQFLGMVRDMSSVAGMNPLLARAMLAQLTALGRQYASDQGKVGANQTFVDYLQQRDPMLVRNLGG
jgi:hypothetical protein